MMEKSCHCFRFFSVFTKKSKLCKMRIKIANVMGIPTCIGFLCFIAWQARTRQEQGCRKSFFVQFLNLFLFIFFFWGGDVKIHSTNSCKLFAQSRLAQMSAMISPPSFVTFFSRGIVRFGGRLCTSQKPCGYLFIEGPSMLFEHSTKSQGGEIKSWEKSEHFRYQTWSYSMGISRTLNWETCNWNRIFRCFDFVDKMPFFSFR